jgi:hypothetical protein
MSGITGKKNKTRPMPATVCRFGAAAGNNEIEQPRHVRIPGLLYFIFESGAAFGGLYRGEKAVARALKKVKISPNGLLFDLGSIKCCIIKL